MGSSYTRLNLFLRRNTPERVKMALRIARLILIPPPPPAPTIPQAQLEGCRLLSSRDDMLDFLPKHGRVVEVGTYQGYFARQILARNRPRELHIVDVTFRDLAQDVRTAPEVRLHEDLSVDALGRFEEGSLDWIYIDADHSYAAVVKDIEAAKSKLKSGGFLVFNDFGRIVRPGFGVLGVHQAVCEFAVREGWAVAFFCLQGEALYDIALRKP